MNLSRKEIIEYHDRLTNEIDILCEKILCEFNDNKIEKDKIDDIRSKIIRKINEIQNSNTANINGNIKFCHFMPFEDINDFGVLIIINEIINDQSLKVLIE